MIHRAMVGERVFGIASFKIINAQNFSAAMAWGMPPWLEKIPKPLQPLVFTLRRSLGMHDADLAFYVDTMGKLDKATELGVASFRLMVTERCVARDLSLRKLERLRAIAREAAEQSERGRVPDVGAPTSLAEALERDSVLLAEREDGVRLSELEPPASVIIGPEGGFTDRELDAARDAGVRLAGLGPRILRSRTVACAVAAAVLSRTGDFA